MRITFATILLVLTLNASAQELRDLGARLLRQMPQAQAEGAKASKNLNYFGLLFTV